MLTTIWRAQALFLPEASDYISHSLAETLSLVRPIEDSIYVKGLQKEAKDNKLAINAGIHEPGDDKKSGKIKNTSIWISEDGEIIERYKKLHLFDMNLTNGPQAHESDVFEEGMEIVPPLQTPVGLVGLLICFDLRFPEVPLSLKRQGAQIITYPSAFTVPTGKAHWEILLRARAIETQSYVVAAAQAGHHNEQRVTYGHSLIIGPWGDILAELGGEFNGPEIATATIDLTVVNKLRQEVPLKRRTDVYPEL
ncbi:carbon-nitrogen hydrolase [Mollisia scopiformis]|uniref:Carbon-nitrogen hydrolase n=1 Tax=Mollisia scopiformis TaxID=149040 RepID=A0A194X872_MOLSC|nr:carbon-nitrogen hydrolase [Mollisia scopiformis]KUJ16370.1 carbon-nitrogen hydrolase [Mollisia scopiformis]